MTLIPQSFVPESFTTIIVVCLWAIFVVPISISNEAVHVPATGESGMAMSFKVPPMENEIREIWAEIQKAREAKLESPAPLNPPANESSIGELASFLGYPIPQPLRESLLTHDGMKSHKGLEIVSKKNIWQAYSALGIDAIQSHWRHDRQRQREAKAEGDPFLKRPDWIPVFVDSAEGDEQIYLDTTDGTILLFNAPASFEVDSFRYPDYGTFLGVLESHIREDRWFEWGNGETADPVVVPLMLNESGINQLIAEQKEAVTLLTPNGDVLAIKENGNDFVNLILESFKPVKFTRTPGVLDPNFELSFDVGVENYKVAIRVGEHLSYSIGNVQFVGGDPSAFQSHVASLKR